MLRTSFLKSKKNQNWIKFIIEIAKEMFQFLLQI